MQETIMPSFVRSSWSSINQSQPFQSFISQDPRMVGFSIEGYYRSGSQNLSIRRLSLRVLSGDLSVYPLRPTLIYPNELTSYIHKLFRLHNCRMTLSRGPRCGSIGTYPGISVLRSRTSSVHLSAVEINRRIELIKPSPTFNTWGSVCSAWLLKCIHGTVASATCHTYSVHY
jgi:hypothetical protein